MKNIFFVYLILFGLFLNLPLPISQPPYLPLNINHKAPQNPPPWNYK